MTKNKFTSALISAMSAGFVFGIAFLVVSVGAIIMTGGDGSAPGITHFMLALISIPVSLLGLSSQGSAGSAAIFWGALVAVLVFIAQLARNEPRQ